MFAKLRTHKREKKKTVAILYIALGRYTVFWKDFYKSAEKYLLTDCEKTYFVWTDNHHIDFQNRKNVTKVYQKKLGWPFDTMMRFEMFLSQEEVLKEFDYIFFFNGNMIFKSKVGTEILPDKAHDGFTVGLHPGFYRSRVEEFTYDRNPKSTAYIPHGEGMVYVAGGLNGGLAEQYLEYCRVCRDNVQKDLSNNIIALWHDESHLNKYILDKNPLMLTSNYLYPEGWVLPEYVDDIKILLADKANPKYGGVAWLRGETDIRIPPLLVWLIGLLRKIEAKKVLANKK